MTRLSPRITLPCLLMLLASLPVAAREVRLQGANGEGSTCPEAAAAADEQAAARAGATRRSTAAPAKGKTPPSARGNDANAVRAPRWHSFLPGMFR